MAEQREEAEVVIVGGGMAGLVAGVELTERDIEPLVLEKGPQPGGSMRISNGVLWTFESLEEVRERAPHGNSALQELLVERFQKDLTWLETLGASLSPVEFDVPGIGKKIDPAAFTQFLSDRIEANGGTVRVETPMQELVTNHEGQVTGVTAMTPDGPGLHVEAPAVILATGGFQGNEQLVEQHITKDTENLWLRANPWSTGDGLLAGQAVGAKSTAGLDTFYGHSLLAPPADFTPDEYAAATQYYGPAAVAIDGNGDRYADESDSELEETLTQATAKLAGGRAYYIIDDAVATETFGLTTANEIIEQAKQFDGRVGEAESLTDLGQILSEWGVNGKRAVDTVIAYNRAVRNNRAERLVPPRRTNRHPIDTPPFYVVEVQPAITFTMGGLAVNEQMEILRRTDSSSGLLRGATDTEGRANPIPGLYAAGADVGNIHRRRYLGGLATALVTGRVAADTAANRVR